MNDERWMQRALDLADEAAGFGEVPVGAVVVLDGHIVGEGCNRPISLCDPTAHAEIQAIRDAARRLGNYRMPGSALYVTIEPCTMCAGALVHARIEKLIYGAREPRSGAVVSVAELLSNPELNHRVSVRGGVLASECAAVLQKFFAQRRKTANTKAANNND